MGRDEWVSTLNNYLDKNLISFYFYSQEKSTDRTIYLVNYPVFLELGTALLANSTPKDIRASFQIYFKHRAKKLIVE